MQQVALRAHHKNQTTRETPQMSISVRKLSPGSPLVDLQHQSHGVDRKSGKQHTKKLGKQESDTPEAGVAGVKG